ncbi:hypothetical protein V5799_005439 [Amblyomma americanum]|uniref:Uncharacterized protein n=1 Tax=Amblyomma americanum TaxID=6943 RepID=A0AAQ4DZ90_AMBAM
MANLTWTLRESPVPAQRQSALQKMTALFCSCVSLVTENRSESAELWAFLDQHGLQPRPVGGKKAAGGDRPDPLESMVYLSVTYGLQPVVAFSSHGDSDQNRYHHVSSCIGCNALWVQ